MCASKFSYDVVLVSTWLVIFTCIIWKAHSVEIECVPVKSCPLVMEQLEKKRQTPEAAEFLKQSHCGYDEWRRPKVWCSKLDWCKTPDNMNGTCVPLKQCKPMFKLMSNLNTVDLDNQLYLEQFRCNKILEDIHVCCPTKPGFDSGGKKINEDYNLKMNSRITDRNADFYSYDYEYPTQDWNKDDPTNFRGMPPNDMEIDAHQSWGNWDSMNWGIEDHPYNHDFIGDNYDSGPQYESDHGQEIGDSTKRKGIFNTHKIESGHKQIFSGKRNTGPAHPHDRPTKDTVYSHETQDHNIMPNNNNKRNTGYEHKNIEITEHQSWASFDRTTPYRSHTTEKTTTINDNVNRFEHDFKRTTADDQTTHNRRWTTERATTSKSRRTTPYRQGTTTLRNSNDEDDDFEYGYDQATSKKTTKASRATTERVTTPGGKSDEDYDHRTSPTKKWNAWEHTTTRNRHSDEDNDDNLDPETFRRKTTAYDHTTERNRNKHESHSPSSTPKRRTTTMKNTTPANRDEDRIIFPDSSEESMIDISKAATEQTKSYTSPTERNINRNKKTCKTPDKKLGICTNEDDCQVYQNLKNNLDKTKKNIRDYLSKFRCNSGNSKDYICCESEANDINNSVVSNERSNENAPDSLSKICGRQTASNDRIVGGTLAGLGEFPWLVMLRYPSNNGLMFGCEGSLISSRYVLTAAHCVDEQLLRSKGLGQLRQVVLGEYDTRNETDCIYMEFGKDCADPSKTYGIEKIIPHRSYNDSTTKHDIALIRLNQEVMFTNYISPICLPTKSPSLNGNETFVIAGWGRTDTDASSPILRKAKIPFVQKKNCNDRSPASRKLIDAQICAGLGNGTDSCNGDSGGPLMLNVNVKFEFVTNIIGIISYGYGKCGTGPSVNTFVPYYIDWIEENMR